MAGLLEEVATRSQPRATVTDEAGVEHRMWELEDGVEIASSLEGDELLIADGHHRYAVALVFRDELHAEHGPGPWDRMMMFIVDAATEDPPVLPIHRVLLSGHPLARGRLVRDLAEVLSEVHDDDLTYGSVVVEEGRAIHRVEELTGQPPTVCALHDQVLADADDRLGFVPDAVQAEESVRTGRAVAAFFLPPTRVERIRSVIDEGRRLPQKSTYFWPKPRTGFVIRSLE
jgi:uncharacterized protein (DUF1015 family)